ncbi:MAG: homoserine dehydrogenase [Methanobacteriaceae archaeon]|nr:homoserine dehydrogenase [Methanobacteriaceae archaeon]MDP2836709.1 homoserine dehydrogenase [Methanobacteriaceae archaeon]MDP3034101.1 homoserine dehydrogenase [Methanobacteriaceae archaeon]MDP3485033.1 homoserine dehydrogenase [Methanobacteriaceae archaeon]MDP3623059.1 homoserine dehydrogenase [Methanobacteriaceae archaeon]
MNKTLVNIGLIGFGTIGSGVIEIFNQNIDLIEKKVGKEVNLKKVVDLDISTDRGVEISSEKLSTDVNDILEDPEISIVIELIGGYEPARSFILKALENGKHVVTANKALLAKHWEEITAVSEKNNVRISFEASVGGGIPLLQPLNESLAANNFEGIYGIINGTANYILTKMSEEGLEFDDVLKEAQEKGYAEQDPTFDIEGHDTAQKLIILTILGFGTYVAQEKFHVEGITKITPQDIEFTSKKLKYVTKLLGITRKVGDELEVRVHPTLIPQDHLLASVNDVFNGVYMIGDSVGPVMMYGQGAGMMPTASAIVGDCIDIISNPEKEITYGPPQSQEKAIKNMAEVVSKYYIRLKALDQPGVLHKISGILSKYHISLESVNQEKNEENQSIPIFMVTHKASEKNIMDAISQIDQLPEIKAPCMLIRILED